MVIREKPACDGLWVVYYAHTHKRVLQERRGAKLTKREGRASLIRPSPDRKEGVVKGLRGRKLNFGSTPLIKLPPPQSMDLGG